MLDSTHLKSTPSGTSRDAVADDRVASGFAELVCADPAWVDAEFDAIMTANFGVLRPCPPPVPPKPRPGSTGPRRSGRAPRSAALARSSSAEQGVDGRVGVGSVPLR